jgi:predicted DNA-binding transcriptional regulator AlpA
MVFGGWVRSLRSWSAEESSELRNERSGKGEVFGRYGLVLANRAVGSTCSTVGMFMRFNTINSLDTIGTPDTVGGLDRVIFVTTVKLRITDIAKATGLSKSTLIRYENEGKLPKARRDGRKWRFYTEADRENILSKLKKLELI